MKLNIQLFAVTKKTTFSEPELTETNIIENQSSLSITIYFSPNNTSTWFSSKKLSCTCNGVTQSANVGLSKGGSVTKTFTFNNIPHENDGTKTVSWSWNCNTGTSVLGNISASGTKQLQTIPRASDITSVTNGTTEYAPVVKWTPKNSTFKFKVKYSFGSWNYTSGLLSPATTIETQYNGYTMPHTVFNNTPNNAKINVTATLYTYQSDGTTLVGEKIKTFEVTLNTSKVPSVSIGTLTEANTQMRNLNWGVFVQNKSQLSIPITANGILGSKIKSIKVTTNGKSQTYKPTTPATTISYTFTTDTLTTSGSNTINVEVTDTRERVGTTSTTYTVQAYSKPKIETTTKAERVDADSDNSYLKYTFVASVTNVGGNASATTYKIGYKLRSDSTYTYISSATFTGTSTLNKTNQTISTPLFSKNNTYDIDFYVKDAFSDSETHVYKELEAEGDLMNFNASGKAMAIGKVSEAGSNEELLEIALPTTISETLSVEKYIKDELVVDSIRSKNMLNLYGFASRTLNGITFTNNGDGSITINGTATTSFGINFVMLKLKAGTYHLSTNASVPNDFYIYDYSGNSGIIANNNTATLTQDYDNVGFDTWINSGVIFNNVTIKPQLEEGSTATTYYPYQNLDGQEVYTTGEARIGTWIDGKPLYRKVITGATTDGDKDIDLTNLNIYEIINVGGLCGNEKPVNFYFAGYSISTRFSGGHLYLFASTPYANLNYRIILEYTKTTD